MIAGGTQGDSRSFQVDRAVALVTGASGFIAGHLIRHLHALGFEVVGTTRQPGSCSSTGRISLIADTGAPAAASGTLENVRPQVIFHLAGSTKPGPDGTFAAEIGVTKALLDAALALEPCPRVVLVGSAAEYGPLPPALLPAGELTPCSPMTDYGRAKLLQTQLGLEAAAAGLPVVIARLFNVVGPGMGEHLALGRFSRTLSSMWPAGGMLMTGDLQGKRDFVPVDEAARLLVELALNDEALGRVIPICSGRAHQMQEVVDALVRASGLAVSVQSQKVQLGVSAVDVMVGDPSALMTLGLRPPLVDLEACMAEIWTATAPSAQAPTQELRERHPEPA
jgi:GDP-4-dehydro-6-deoxy-D-mannose reductase